MQNLKYFLWRWLCLNFLRYFPVTLLATAYFKWCEKLWSLFVFLQETDCSNNTQLKTFLLLFCNKTQCSLDLHNTFQPGISKSFAKNKKNLDSVSARHGKKLYSFFINRTTEVQRCHATGLRLQRMVTGLGLEAKSSDAQSCEKQIHIPHLPCV